MGDEKLHKLNLTFQFQCPAARGREESLKQQAPVQHQIELHENYKRKSSVLEFCEARPFMKLCFRQERRPGKKKNKATAEEGISIKLLVFLSLSRSSLNEETFVNDVKRQREIAQLLRFITQHTDENKSIKRYFHDPHIRTPSLIIAQAHFMFPIPLPPFHKFFSVFPIRSLDAITCCSRRGIVT